MLSPGPLAMLLTAWLDVGVQRQRGSHGEDSDDIIAS